MAGEHQVTEDFIAGAKLRAMKGELPICGSAQIVAGYQSMDARLLKIEQEIVRHTLRYKVIAETYVKELEDNFRDSRAVYGDEYSSVVPQPVVDNAESSETHSI